MKKLVLFLVLVTTIVLMSFNLRPESQPYHTIEGTWELQSFYFYEDQEVIDTVPTSDGYRQVKMYYNGKIMWSRTNPADSIDAVGRFGYGSYRITDTELIETIEYGDIQMMRALDTMRVFTFELILTDSTFSQISWDENGNRTFSENYLRID